MREQLKVETTSEPRQFAINNLPIELGTRDWNDVYVSFSGYFGIHGPQVFAAAPVLLEALQEMVEFFQPNAWGSSTNRTDALAKARTAIDKANAPLA